MNDRVKFDFLKDVQDGDLMTWKAHAESPLHGFMIIHFEKKIRMWEESALRNDDFHEKPYEFARRQGKAAGIRLVLKGFFNAVTAELNKRLSGTTPKRADKPGR